jgi:hypothetical protein
MLYTFLKAKFHAQTTKAVFIYKEWSYDLHSSGQWAKVKSVITYILH